MSNVQNYKVLSLVTTYFPEPETEENIDLISAQSDLTVVIDNGSPTEQIAFLNKYHKHPKVRVIYNQSNLGIAHTSNQAREICLQEGYDFLLNFDQDSTPPVDFVQSMLAVYREIAKQEPTLFEKIGVLMPTHYLAAVDKISKKNTTDSKYTIVSNGMSSGSLILRKVFEQGVTYEDKLFVDYFDSDFFLKVRQQGFQLVECSQVCLKHYLASLQRRSFLGKKCVTSNYSPTRRYYQTRNAVFMYRKYYKDFPEWVREDLRDKIMDTLKLILLESKKLPKLKAMLFGLKDGLQDKWQNPVQISF